MNRKHRTWQLLSLVGLMWLLVACGGANEPAASTLEVPTQTTAPADDSVPPTATAPALALVTLPPPPTLANPTVDSNTALPAEATPTPLPGAPETPTGYRVVYVAPDDVLNVRAEAGTGGEIVAELAPDADGLALTGATTLVEGSLWAEVSVGDGTGWVNSRFLTLSVPGADFCDDPQVAALLDALLEAVTNRDDAALSALIQPDRGLRLNRNWWNPTVLLDGETAAAAFSSSEVLEWGMADGSGEPISGTFSEVALPLLDKNLLPATELACNEIAHGGTAGLVRLPDGYEGINYYSLYRPAGPDQNEFDWGTWVVGIEQWAGGYNIAYLVHFEWEI